MKKVILCCTLGLLFLTGCDSDQKEIRQNSKEVIRTVVSYGVNVWCDKKTNIEYLIFKGYKSGGMTIRYNANGTPKQCINNKKGL